MEPTYYHLLSIGSNVYASLKLLVRLGSLIFLEKTVAFFFTPMGDSGAYHAQQT